MTKRMFFALFLTVVALGLGAIWKIPTVNALVGGVDHESLSMLVFVAAAFVGCMWLLVLLVPRDAIEKLSRREYKLIKNLLARKKGEEKLANAE